MQALRLGDGLDVIALPGEWFVATGWQIQRQAGFRRLLVNLRPG